MKAIPDSWSRPWLAIAAALGMALAVFELIAVFFEYVLRDRRKPTISRILVALFQLRWLQVVTIALGFILAIHWWLVSLGDKVTRFLGRFT